MKTRQLTAASILFAFLLNIQMGCNLFERPANHGQRVEIYDDRAWDMRNIQKKVAPDEQVDHHGQSVTYNEDPNDCIVCHDGFSAPEARFCTVDCGFGTPHPILKEYPPRSKERSYMPSESLQAKGIRLFNGKVSCVSCHDLKKTTKYHLVIDNAGSALCFSCHIT